MATPAHYYDSIGAWLAGQGFLTLLFDYRGMGTPNSIRAETCDLVRWALDGASALERLLDEAGGAPITWVGHSLGGQILPFVRHDLLSRVVLVSTGHGYWKLNAPSIRRRAHFMWRYIAPTAIRTFGYFPGRRLGILDDVPANVMRQWIRWCLHPDYMKVDFPDIEARFAEVTPPVTAISFSDDDLLSERAMTAFEALLTMSDVTRMHVDPAEVGHSRVGHNGLFRRTSHDLWEKLVLPGLTTADIEDES